MLLTASAKHADIVLPATTSFERNDLTMTGDYSNQHMVPMKRVVAPRDEARDDFDVFAELSELWEAGGRERFTEGKTDLEWLETFYQIAAQRGAAQVSRYRPLLNSGKQTRSSKCRRVNRTRSLSVSPISDATRRSTR